MFPSPLLTLTSLLALSLSVCAAPTSPQHDDHSAIMSIIAAHDNPTNTNGTATTLTTRGNSLSFETRNYLWLGGEPFCGNHSCTYIPGITKGNYEEIIRTKNSNELGCLSNENSGTIRIANYNQCEASNEGLGRWFGARLLCRFGCVDTFSSGF